MEVMVIACYKPKPGKQSDLLALMRTHLPILKEQGLVGDGPSLCGAAADGTVIETFCWRSQAAIDAAHGNPAVQKMWGDFAEVCDFVCVGDIPEARQLFAGFAPVNLQP